ncbi:MAG TPA: UDP-N-acetylmuramate dehydrogenase [Holophaga sp.]|nr:UDP-N-acetylmuramate dehydrogenase [Holophaga sp.]HPS68093.1 UDP-N-acetylmuramate dehydrogenase [Holophaga sp.]
MSIPLPDELLKLPHTRDIPFERLTTLGIGGICRWLFEPSTEEEARLFVGACVRRDQPYRVLGGGSNLLVLGDVAEPVLRLRLGGKAARSGLEFTAPASHGHVALAEAAAAAGLSGLEWAGGIPGSLGGAVRMNAGAHGGEWGQVLARYRFLTPAGELVEKAPGPGEFGYRRSGFPPGAVVLSATARLAEGDPARIHALMAEYRAKRAAGQPRGVRSAGCIFRNPPGGSAGRLIDAAGLKGRRVGDAEVSLVHANFLVNRGHATPSQFLELMELVRAGVKEAHGVDLEPEVEIWR